MLVRKWGISLARRGIFKRDIDNEDKSFPLSIGILGPLNPAVTLSADSVIPEHVQVTRDTSRHVLDPMLPDHVTR